jgi:MoaA/NifB/PqqE/SkfB family radical SAM enzyme
MDFIIVTITGGEPFLHDRIFEIIELIKKRGSLNTISTNGTLRDEIVYFIVNHNKDFQTGIHISVDGIRSHDKIRGRSLDKIISNIEYIKSRFPSQRIKIKTLILPKNYDEIIPTYEFFIGKGIEVSFKIVEKATNYTNKIDKKRFIFTKEMVGKISEQLEQLKHKNYPDTHFLSDTISFINRNLSKKSCKVPKSKLFIFPNTDVYSCIHLGVIGNINDSLVPSGKNRFDHVLDGNTRKKHIKEMEDGCDRCVSYHGRVT